MEVMLYKDGLLRIMFKKGAANAVRSRLSPYPTAFPTGTFGTGACADTEPLIAHEKISNAKPITPATRGILIASLQCAIDFGLIIDSPRFRDSSTTFRRSSGS